MVALLNSATFYYLLQIKAAFVKTASKKAASWPIHEMRVLDLR